MPLFGSNLCRGVSMEAIPKTISTFSEIYCDHIPLISQVTNFLYSSISWITRQKNFLFLALVENLYNFSKYYSELKRNTLFLIIPFSTKISYW